MKRYIGGAGLLLTLARIFLWQNATPSQRCEIMTLEDICSLEKSLEDAN